MKRILWWVCLLLAPAVPIGLELFHPANFTAHPGMYQYLSQAEPHSAAHHHASTISVRDGGWCCT
jgi:membrane glycosyltransferase